MSFQQLVDHVDGTLIALPTTIEVEGKSAPNPEFLTWKEADQKAFLILQSSLSEEAMTETIGLQTAREVWVSLERAYCHDSQERMQTLQ